MELDSRSISVINLLRQTRAWTTCSTISKELNLSPRSVRYVISKINKQEQLILSSKKGYIISEDIYEDNLISDQPVSSTPEERKKYIFHKLIILNEVLDMDELANHFHISRATLLNNLPDLKKELEENKLFLKTKQNNLYVIGKERHKQKYAVKLIRDEVEHSNFSLTNIQQYFHTVDLCSIKKLITDVFSKYQYYLDDYSLLNYVIHLAVCIELSKNDNQKQGTNNCKASSASELKCFASDEIIEIVQDITNQVNTQYGISFSIEHILEASVLMMTRIVSTRNCTIGFENISLIVGDEIRDLIIEIMDSVYDKYYIDLSNKQLMIRFAVHLKNLLLRVNNDIHIQNAQFKNIKNEYPFLYDLAVFVSYTINNRLRCQLPEEEIAYIALHLGVMIEQNTTIHEKLTCVLFSTDYYTIGKSLLKNITRIFSQELFIQDLITNAEKLDRITSNVDLIITTYPLKNTAVPYVVVGPFLSEPKVSEIFNKIETIKQIKNKKHILSKIEFFLKKDLCFFGRDFKTSKDAIEVMCNYMLEKNYVEENFKNEIYEHENVAPSSYGNIAIAHTFSNSDLPSVIAMAINPEPISWGSNQVNVVFMISLNKKDNKLFKDIFKFLTNIITNNDALALMLKTTSYTELIEIINHYI